MLHVLILTALLFLATMMAPACGVADSDVGEAEAVDGSPKTENFEAVRERAKQVHIPALPALDEIMAAGRQQPKTASVETLADQGMSLVEPPASGADSGQMAIYVFVSFSMPLDMLQELLEQARRVQAPLVLRGLVSNSMPATMMQIQKLVGSGGDEKERLKDVGIIVDPTLYRRFGVKSVPAVVVSETSVDGCRQTECPTPPHYALAGDVSLGWALNRIASESPTYERALRPHIERLEGR